MGVENYCWFGIGLGVGIIAVTIDFYFKQKSGRRTAKKREEDLLLSTRERAQLTIAKLGINEALCRITQDDVQGAYEALARTNSLVGLAEPVREPENTAPNLRVINGGCPKAE